MNWQVPDDWVIPELRKLLDDVLPGNGGFEGFEVDHDFPRVGAKRCC
jgi:two-component system CheB/CheR fusion protein